MIGRGVVVEEAADLEDSIVWPNTRIGQNAIVDGADHRPQLPRRPQLRAEGGVRCLGDKTQLTDYTSIGHD